MTEPGTITRLLRSWQAGSEEAYQQVFAKTIDVLRGIAGNYLNKEKQDYATLSLINDAFAHLAEKELVNFKDRKHFLRFFSMVMRRKVIDKARALQTQKSGGLIQTVDIAEGVTLAITPTKTEEILDLDKALAELEQHDALLAQVVHLRYFLGMTIREIAEDLAMGETTVKTKWSTARAFLLKHLQENKEDE
ncbi:MAG: ECF-type sigma factor [Acidobacteriota bacterium]|nr:ECF-type sigma factor [Acidobacteriota bacterium]